MARLLLTRIALFVPTLFAASVVLFVAINVVPGSAARSALGVDATPQAIMRFEALNGLNRPLVVQYTDWLGRALHGDLGTSFQNRLPGRQCDRLAARRVGGFASRAAGRCHDFRACDGARRDPKLLASDVAGARLFSSLEDPPGGWI